MTAPRQARLGPEPIWRSNQSSKRALSCATSDWKKKDASELARCKGFQCQTFRRGCCIDPALAKRLAESRSSAAAARQRSNRPMSLRLGEARSFDHPLAAASSKLGHLKAFPHEPNERYPAKQTCMLYAMALGKRTEHAAY